MKLRPADNAAGVRDKLRISNVRPIWRPEQRAKRSFVYTVNIPSRLLKFILNEERARHSDSSLANARLIRAALGDLQSPIIQTRLIRNSIKKIRAMLTHKELCD